jgi:GAF domain-containing protein
MSDDLRAENERLKAEIQAYREFVSALEAISEQAANVTTNAQLMPMLADILERAMTLTEAQIGVLALLDAEKQALMFAIVSGGLADQLTGMTMPADEGILGWCVQNQQAILVPDAQADERFSRRIDDEHAFVTRSVAAAPLIGDGRVVGVVEVLRQQVAPFDADSLQLMKLLCRLAGEALVDIERRR